MSHPEEEDLNLTIRTWRCEGMHLERRHAKELRVISPYRLRVQIRLIDRLCTRPPPPAWPGMIASGCRGFVSVKHRPPARVAEAGHGLPSGACIGASKLSSFDCTFRLPN